MLALGVAAVGTRRAGGAQPRRACGSIASYVLVGLVLWVFVLKSGVHATLAGVALALAIPLRGRGRARCAACWSGWSTSLHPWVAFGVLPLFGFRQCRRLARRALTGDTAGTGPARHRARALPRQADRRLRLARRGDRARGSAGAGGRELAAALRRRHPGRHRLHDEPVHRHAWPSGNPSSKPSMRLGVLVGSALSAVVGAGVLGFSRARPSSESRSA